MSKSLEQHKDEFSDWCDLWDQACEKGIFPEQPKLDPLPEFDNLSDDYYNNIDRMADEDDGFFSESKEPNSIMPDSRGKDSCVHDAPWVDEPTIEAVADLKRQLYEIECELIAKDAGGSKWQHKAKTFTVGEQKLVKKLTSIQEKIDKLSDNLGLKEAKKAK